VSIALMQPRRACLSLPDTSLLALDCARQVRQEPLLRLLTRHSRSVVSANAQRNRPRVTERQLPNR
jgi:hypothetical protein